MEGKQQPLQHYWLIYGPRFCNMWSFVQHRRTFRFLFHGFVGTDSWFWSNSFVKTSVETFAAMKLAFPCLNYSIRCWNNILSVFWFGVLQGWFSYIPDDDLSIWYTRVEFFKQWATTQHCNIKIRMIFQGLFFLNLYGYIYMNTKWALCPRNQLSTNFHVFF